MINTNVKVGFVSFLMLSMIGALMMWQSTLLMRASGYELKGEFQNINGLLNGAEVRYRGFKVGRVSKVSPGPKKILVSFYVKDDIEVPQGSELRVIFDGLIGEKLK